MNRAKFDARISNALLDVEKLIPKQPLPDLPYTELAPTVHDWYGFEPKLLALGENVF